MKGGTIITFMPRSFLVATVIYCLSMSFSTHSFALENLVVGYQAITANQTPLWVASDRGFFTKYGLKV